MAAVKVKQETPAVKLWEACGTEQQSKKPRRVALRCELCGKEPEEVLGQLLSIHQSSDSSRTTSSPKRTTPKDTDLSFHSGILGDSATFLAPECTGSRGF